MKHFHLMGMSIFCLFLFNCEPSDNDSSPPTGDTTGSSGYTVSVSVTESNNPAYASLPDLQSFVHAQDDQGRWLFFGGRKNGFHGFGANEGFPIRLANDSIYAFDPTGPTLAGFSVDQLAAEASFATSFPDWGDQWSYFMKGTNHQQFQSSDGLLTVCGGYGQGAGPDTNSTETYPYAIQLNTSDAIDAILGQSSEDFFQSFQGQTPPADSTSNEIVQVTGGELFAIGDQFYLVFGQNFNGSYSGSNPIQKYTYRVGTFQVNDNGTAASGIPTMSIIQQDSFTTTDSIAGKGNQFRRRDLPVVPEVQDASGTAGISVYSGVFTTDTKEWSNPIFVTNSGATLNTTFSQTSNFYSCPSFSFWDGTNQVSEAILMGGIGNGAGNLDYTNNVLSLQRDFSNGGNLATIEVTPEVKSQISASDDKFYGAEAVLIETASAGLYYDQVLGILDVEKLAAETQPVTIGLIYGGIVADDAKATWQETAASDKVFEIQVTIE